MSKDNQAARDMLANLIRRERFAKKRMGELRPITIHLKPEISILLHQMALSQWAEAHNAVADSWKILRGEEL